VPVLMNLVSSPACFWPNRFMGWDMGRTLAWTVTVSGVLQLLFDLGRAPHRASACRSAGRG
jgi:putative peptidoglycan lipid II flippase